MMWRCMGLRRNAEDLRIGLHRLHDLMVEPPARGPAQQRIQLMSRMMQAALTRTASIGAHWRDDAPDAVVVPVNADAVRAA